MSWDSSETTFQVVVNQEEQYSVWPRYKAVPAGWTAVEAQGQRQACLGYIEQVWTDMRPLSLRKQLGGMAR